MVRFIGAIPSGRKRTLDFQIFGLSERLLWRKADIGWGEEKVPNWPD